MADDVVTNPLAAMANNDLIEAIGMLRVGCLRTRAVPSRRNKTRTCALAGILDVERQNRGLPPVVPPFKA